MALLAGQPENTGSGRSKLKKDDHERVWQEQVFALNDVYTMND